MTGIGYSRAGEVPPRSWGIRVQSGAGPLFRFSCWHEESDDETMLTASRKDLETLAQGVAREVGASASVLPRLPGRKLVNANSSQHLEKRLRRYATFLQELADHATAGRSAALAAFWGVASVLSLGSMAARSPAPLWPESLDATGTRCSKLRCSGWKRRWFVLKRGNAGGRRRLGRFC